MFFKAVYNTDWDGSKCDSYNVPLIIIIMVIIIMTIIRFVGKDQSVMAATCLLNPGLCLLVKSNGNWFYLQVFSLLSFILFYTFDFVAPSLSDGLSILFQLKSFNFGQYFFWYCCQLSCSIYLDKGAELINILINIISNGPKFIFWKFLLVYPFTKKRIPGF